MWRIMLWLNPPKRGSYHQNIGLKSGTDLPLPHIMDGILLSCAMSSCLHSSMLHFEFTTWFQWNFRILKSMLHFDRRMCSHMCSHSGAQDSSKMNSGFFNRKCILLSKSHLELQQLHFLQHSSFLIQDSSFSKQNSSFLIQNPSFLPRACPPVPAIHHC